MLGHTPCRRGIPGRSLRFPCHPSTGQGLGDLFSSARPFLPDPSSKAVSTPNDSSLLEKSATNLTRLSGVALSTDFPDASLCSDIPDAFAIKKPNRAPSTNSSPSPPSPSLDPAGLPQRLFAQRHGRHPLRVFEHPRTRLHQSPFVPQQLP